MGVSGGMVQIRGKLAKEPRHFPAAKPLSDLDTYSVYNKSIDHDDLGYLTHILVGSNC